MTAKLRGLTKFLTLIIVFIAAVAFVIKFAGPNLLRQYITFGIGDCKNIPILCMEPEDKIFIPEINAEYLATLTPHAFPKMSISTPKGFNLVQELIKKRYYKKRNKFDQAFIYLLPQQSNDFIKLYPDVKKQGVNDNQEFIRRLMSAKINTVNNLTDAFFTIMKSVFTPDIGNQKIAKMIKFTLLDLNGFISYTMAKPNNYFDCNVLDNQGNFYKVYIKDIGARLDLNQVFTILSTLKSIN